MAIGAREQEVLFQFLVEAAMLAGFGGLVGIVVGLGSAWAIAPMLNVPFIIQPDMMVMAFRCSRPLSAWFLALCRHAALPALIPSKPYGTNSQGKRQQGNLVFTRWSQNRCLGLPSLLFFSSLSLGCCAILRSYQLAVGPGPIPIGVCLQELPFLVRYSCGFTTVRTMVPHGWLKAG